MDQRGGVSGLSGEGCGPLPGCIPGEGTSGDEASGEGVFGEAVSGAPETTSGVAGVTAGCAGFGSG